jgi:serine/threonine-protein phosphatase 2A activator
MQHPSIVSRNAYIKLKDSSEIPTKKIVKDNFTQFPSTEAYYRIVDFLQTVNETIKVKDETPIHYEDCTWKILELLDKVERLAFDIEPVMESNRFGSISFRDLVDRMEANSSCLLQDIIPDSLYLNEISVYFVNAFGDKSRIDYGSGHELNFVCWLLCLHLIGNFQTNLKQILVIFKRYLALMRFIQIRYRLEPAGSHGVWGLDDFHFLPFYWGSAELVDSDTKPSVITDKSIVESKHQEYLYFSCIQFIIENKKGPFFEHSPILYDISGVASWSKVNSGLFKMYLGEVLGKFVVAQHIYFGSLLPYEKASEIQPPIQ